MYYPVYFWLTVTTILQTRYVLKGITLVLVSLALVYISVVAAWTLAGVHALRRWAKAPVA